MEYYLYFVRTYPLLSSAIQVALLGTLGELLAIRIRLGQWYFFGPGVWKLTAKILVWGLLGISFKYAFAGFFGFTDAIIEKGFWFSAAKDNLIIRALSVSLFTNLLFGPVMMLFHRIADNSIEGKEMDWNSLQKAWRTLIWFWIPAHTLTFALPSEYQVGLAALWAVALGVILGFYAKK